MRSTIDTVAGGTLMNKTKDEAHNLIEEMPLMTTNGLMIEANP